MNEQDIRTLLATFDKRAANIAIDMIAEFLMRLGGEITDENAISNIQQRMRAEIAKAQPPAGWGKVSLNG